MKKVICSVHDMCANMWTDPFFAVNTASAIRGFTDHVNGSNGDMSNHPEHFNLFKIGEFDDNKGLIDNLDEPVCLVRAIDIKSVE